MRDRRRNKLRVAFFTIVTLSFFFVFVKKLQQIRLIPKLNTETPNIISPVKPQLNILDLSNQLCLGKGTKPVLPKFSKMLYHLEFRKEKFEFLKNFENPCFYRNVSYYNGKSVQTPVSTLRCLPYFFMIGQPKCGTTDIWNGLTLHPEVVAHQIKEPFYFDLTRFPPYNWSFDKYLDEFHKTTETIASNPSPDKKLSDAQYYRRITGDGSICTATRNDHWYLVPGNEGCNEPRILNAHVLRHLNPNLKLIMSLRSILYMSISSNEMLYSNYIFTCRQKRRKISVTDFHQAVTETIKNHSDCRKYFSERGCAYNGTFEIHKATLRYGMYHVFLEDWFRVFPTKQMMIVYFEDYMKDRVAVLQEIFKFLELRPLSKEEEALQTKREIANLRRKKDREIGDMMNETRTILEQFYAPFNKQLAKLLNDEKFLWRS